MWETVCQLSALIGQRWEGERGAKKYPLVTGCTAVPRWKPLLETCR